MLALFYYSLGSSIAFIVIAMIARWYIHSERIRSARVAESTDRGLYRFSDGVKSSVDRSNYSIDGYGRTTIDIGLMSIRKESRREKKRLKRSP